jgi:hypothetical protein
MNAIDATKRTATTSVEDKDSSYLGRPGVLRSSKILDLHLDRLAIVYVRQSDPQQVLNNRESRERQLPFRTSRDEYPRISLTPQLTLVNGW